VDALVVLEKRGGRNHVSESCGIKGEEVVQRMDREGVVAHQEPAASSGRIGGAMVSGYGSLAAL
jgi:hypothetical protein